MAGALHRQELGQRVALSDISSDLGLPETAVRELRSLGIRSAEDLLGLIYAAFEDLAAELDITPQDLSRISSRLRDYIGEDELEPGGGYFIVRNSWGEGWARESPFGSGYGYISYGYIQRFNADARTGTI
jgi:hypothetical protein